MSQAKSSRILQESSWSFLFSKEEAAPAAFSNTAPAIPFQAPEKALQRFSPAPPQIILTSAFFSGVCIAASIDRKSFLSASCNRPRLEFLLRGKKYPLQINPFVIHPASPIEHSVLHSCLMRFLCLPRILLYSLLLYRLSPPIHFPKNFRDNYDVRRHREMCR